MRVVPGRSRQRRPCLNPGHGVKEKFRPDSLHGSKNARVFRLRAARFPSCSGRRNRSIPRSQRVSSPLSRRLRLWFLPIVMAGMAPAWAQVLPQVPQVPAPVPAVPRPHDPGQRGLSDAVRRAERAGQVLSAEHVQYDGRDVNRVKIVDDRGRVRVYWDDPATDGDGAQDTGQTPARPAPPRGRTRRHDDGHPTL